MRNTLTFVLAATLLACSPPTQQSPSEAPAPTPPAVVACNDVAPDLARAVSVQDSTVAVAVADLRGGAIAPATYDLVSATRVGQPTGWSGGNAVALRVDESAAGEVTFNWAGARAGQTDRWTASFAETPEPGLTFTCGRTGHVETAFNAAGGQLNLRLPDGANGSLDLVFARRD